VAGHTSLPRPDDSPVEPCLRRFRGDQEAEEELVVSFPSAEIARIHCHGGMAACENVLKALETQGVQQVPWQEIADPWRTALAHALTERTALLLLEQSPAAWQEKIDAWIANLDQPSGVATVREQVEQLLAQALLGLHLTEPWRIVIAGSPNAGKSSLLNALLGYQRSIIHDKPGTTRDVVTARTAFDGWPVELRDTAGLRYTHDEIESAGVARAKAEIRSADLLLYVIPADVSIGELCVQEARAEALKCQNRSTLIVRSKSDLAAEPRTTGELFVSAKTGAGMADLIAVVVQRLVGEVPEPGALLPYYPELVDRLRKVQVALATEQLPVARTALQCMLTSA
jgi:tRNA modification GTPase